MIFLLGLMSAVIAIIVDPEHNMHLETVLPSYGVVPRHDIYKVALSPKGDVQLSWWLDYAKQMVTIRVDMSPEEDFDWFAVGFSYYGDTKNADYCIMRHLDDVGVIQDYIADADGHVTLDKHQDCLHPIWNQNENYMQFSRHFDTCDEEDYIIEEGTTHILWAEGRGLCGPQPDSQAVHKGMVRVQLLKNNPNAKINQTSNMYSRPLIFGVKDVKVPGTDTTYYCSTFKLPDWLLEKQHQIIMYESLVTLGNEGLVHHMEIFYCDAPKDHVVESYEGPCDQKPQSAMVCSKVRAAWAMGATPFHYPIEAGLSIGGPDSNPSVMIEVHYNNPDMKNDWVDSSGIRLLVTSELRKYEASIMELGLEYTDKMMIPPKQETFQLSGYCTSACTAIGLPEGGIIVFGSQLHTHTTGAAVETRHYRDGKELPMLNQDKHYSTHFQEIRILKRFVHIKPGDYLVTSCKYKTLDRPNITFGGHSIQDEMCVNYIHYYPASNLEVCKSSVSTEALKNFFDFETNQNGVPINDNMTVREKYGTIPSWSPLMVDTLTLLFDNQSIAMQCNTSSGERFPGKWDPSEKDIVLTRLPMINTRKCPPVK